MWSVRLLVNTRLLIVKFWGCQKLYTDFQLCGDHAPSPHAAQRPTVVTLTNRNTHYLWNSCVILILNMLIWDSAESICGLKTVKQELDTLWHTEKLIPHHIDLSKGYQTNPILQLITLIISSQN